MNKKEIGFADDLPSAKPVQGRGELIFSVLGLLTEIPPDGPSGPRHFCAKVLGLWPKTLAQGEFISPEHVKLPPVSIKITTPDGVAIFMVRAQGFEP